PARRPAPPATCTPVSSTLLLPCVSTPFQSWQPTTVRLVAAARRDACCYECAAHAALPPGTYPLQRSHNTGTTPTQRTPRADIVRSTAWTPTAWSDEGRLLDH